jgi:hypothetical protein
MLMVKTRLGPSDIAGIGLFADQDIPKGTVTWQFMSGYDLLLTQGEIDRLPEPARSNLRDHTYRDSGSGLYILCVDNAVHESRSRAKHRRSPREGGDRRP